MRNHRILMAVMPWLLIVLGFLSLSILPPIVAGSCMLVGLVILIERIWPEKLDVDAQKKVQLDK